ncbi:MAG: hypothetical protein WA903_07310 [Ornithinimicrobium sp.]
MPQHSGPVLAQRVALASGVRPVRRGSGEIQFGLTPERGIVMAGLTEAEAGWLLSLGGPGGLKAEPRCADPGVLVASAAGWGVSLPRARELLDVLHTHGVVVQGPSSTPETKMRSPSPARTRTPVVCVLGHGGVPNSIRAQVGALGSPRVHSELDVAEPAEMTVVVVRDAISARDRSWWARSPLVHLPVVVGDRRAVLGPVITRGTPGPCLLCLDLTRRDRDTAWPLIVAQIADSTGNGTGQVNTDPILTAAVAASTAMVVRAHLDGLGVPSGVTWEVALPWPDVRTRRWPRHVACPDHP